jgi:hypothetical protein
MNYKDVIISEAKELETSRSLASLRMTGGLRCIQDNRMSEETNHIEVMELH